VAYDIDLASRVRELLGSEPAATEKRMFGGLAFLVGGHMAIASGQGGLLLRVDPAERETLLADPRASRSVMGGREMAGWLSVDIDESTTHDELSSTRLDR